MVSATSTASAVENINVYMISVKTLYLNSVHVGLVNNVKTALIVAVAMQFAIVQNGNVLCVSVLICLNSHV